MKIEWCNNCGMLNWSGHDCKSEQRITYIDQLVSRIKELEELLVRYAQYEEDADETIDKLEEQLEKATEMISFYADDENWFGQVCALGLHPARDFLKEFN